MARAKRRTVALLLACFAVWPLAHYALVQHYGLNPWKFFGWAMYTTPHIRPRVEVYALDGGNRVKLPLVEKELAAAAAERDRLRVESGMWGRLARPERLAQLVAEVLEPSEGVEIVTLHYRLDPGSARLTASRESFFQMSGDAPPANSER